MMAVVLAVSSLGAPPLTTIEDTLYKADGTPFDGILAISWRSFEGPGYTNVPTNSLSAQVVGGNLFIKLIPTTTAPTAAYYSVRYVSEGSVESTELWSVPQSSTPLQVRDVRIEWPPTIPAPGQATEVLIDDVVGLRDELDIRTVKGLTYTPSRAAAIGATGELEAAVGELTDCVRVDGSSGPCGDADFVDGETPSGTLNGVNTSFTLSGTPNPESSLQLYRNGLLQKDGTDYTVTGSAISFLLASVPQTGDVLVASYRSVGT